MLAPLLPEEENRTIWQTESLEPGHNVMLTSGVVGQPDHALDTLLGPFTCERLSPSTAQYTAWRVHLGRCSSRLRGNKATWRESGHQALEQDVPALL